MTTLQMEQNVEKAAPLLIEILRARYTDRDDQRIAAACTDVSETAWKQAVRFHGMAGILSKFHQDDMSACLPQKFSKLVAAQQDKNVRNALFQAALLKTTLATLNKAQICAVPFKGLSLSSYLYADMTIRSVGDIDLLIAPEDLAETLRLLEQIGWQYISSFSQPLSDITLQYMHHCQLKWSSGETLELHWRTTRSLTLALPNLATLESQLVPGDTPSLTYPTFNSDLLTHIVMVHSNNALCAKLKWSIDVLDLAYLHTATPTDPKTAYVKDIATRLAAHSLRLTSNTQDRKLPAVVRLARRQETKRLLKGRDNTNLITGLVRGMVRLVASMLLHPPSQRLAYIKGWWGHWRTIIFNGDAMSDDNFWGDIKRSIGQRFQRK